MTFFERENYDTTCEIPITFTEAALGTEVEVPTLDGKAKLRIPPGTQTGTKFRIRNKGIPHFNGRRRGDQHVKVKVQVPQNCLLSKRSYCEILL